MNTNLAVGPRAAVRKALLARFTAVRVLTMCACLIVVVQFTAYMLIEANRADRTALEAKVATLADLASAISNAEDALHNVAGHQNSGESIARFYTSLRDVETLIPRLGQASEALALGRDARVDIRTLVAGWRRTVAAYESNEDARAIGYLMLPASERAMDEVQRAIEQVIVAGRADAARRSATIRTVFTTLFWFQIGSVVLLMLAIGFAYRRVKAESEARRDAIENEAGTRRRLELLFGMHDMLQAAEDHRDANLILSATASDLAPDVTGALYVFNNSGDRLHLSTQWGRETGVAAFAQTIAPNECWALKRGKPHLNGDSETGLRCVHAGTGGGLAIEVPMIARGTILGMLMLMPDAASHDDHDELRLIATALADGMSLALSNIALRERLRNQALRDGLTGLYNRRYMEDALERIFDASGPDAPASSVIMIDLDHFKRINDEHGHAIGDNILRDVGPLLVSGLRKTDVACRYGGEELVVVLANCDHDDAMARAEMIRMRIEQLSETYNFRITASLGVGTFGQHGRTIPALMSSADAALYAAKTNGRNRVMSADPTRPVAGGSVEHLAVAAE